MTRNVLVGLLGLTISASAYELHGPASVLARPTSFAALPTIYSAPRTITLSDQSAFSFQRAFTWMSSIPVAFLPAFSPDLALSPGAAGRTTRPSNEHRGLGDFVPKINYAGGEVGLIFGKSLDGRRDRELEGGYILGEIISGQTHLGVGASYTRDKTSR